MLNKRGRKPYHGGDCEKNHRASARATFLFTETPSQDNRVKKSKKLLYRRPRPTSSKNTRQCCTRASNLKQRTHNHTQKQAFILQTMCGHSVHTYCTTRLSRKRPHCGDAENYPQAPRGSNHRDPLRFASVEVPGGSKPPGTIEMRKARGPGGFETPRSLCNSQKQLEVPGGF